MNCPTLAAAHARIAGLERQFSSLEQSESNIIPDNAPNLGDSEDWPIGAKGLQLIQHFEGCLEPIDGGARYRAYADPIGVWTIGWGSIRHPDGRKVKRGDEITAKEAEDYLLHEIRDDAKAVDGMVHIDLEEHQRDALLSFCYNLGRGNLRKSTLLKKVNREDFSGAANEFGRWVYAGGKRFAGLVRRRKSEAHLFRTGELEFFL